MLLHCLFYVCGNLSVAKHVLIEVCAEFSIRLLSVLDGNHLCESPLLFVILVECEVSDEFRHARRKLLSECVHDLGFIIKVKILYEFSDIDRLADVDKGSASVSEIITVFETCRNDIDRFFSTEFLVGCKCCSENTFSKSLKRVLWTMGSFWEHAESHVIFKDLHDNLLSVLVFQHIAQSVSLSYHREDTRKVHELCDQWFLEDVSSCTEYCRLFVRPKYHQCIQQCIAMVRSNEYCAVSWDVLQSMYLTFPVAMSYIRSHPGLYKIVFPVVLVYFFSHKLKVCFTLQLPFCRGFSMP